MAPRDNELGAFLRASRARLEPADAGLPTGTSARRVAGLRREEVAVLAGVSADYYARLEQGRERNPSAQVIDAIGRALRLRPDEHGHLYRLAGLSPGLTGDDLKTVHALRLNAGYLPDYQHISGMVDEMTDRSAEFRALWEDHNVGGLTRAFKVFVHPVEGPIELTYQIFDVTDAPSQQLLVGTPMPGSSTAAVARLTDADQKEMA